MLDSTAASDRTMDQLMQVDQLRILHISNTLVTDAAVESIAAIQGLQGVYMSGTGITLAGATKLKKLRPEIWLVHESIGVAWGGGEVPNDVGQQGATGYDDEVDARGLPPSR